MIPEDCEPTNENEMVFEILSGPDREDKHVWFGYWVSWRGTRGQIFKANLQQHQEKHEKVGRTVRVVDRRR